jgi:hypothetical protein
MKARQVILAILYIVIAAAIVFAVVTTKGFGLLNRNSSSDWQAIFLDNGQVYFGHMKSQNSQYVSLSNIYYLQVSPAQGSTPATGTSATTTDTANQQLTLVKLGNELHGPTDEMSINRDHITFIETMKSDSKVVTAIADYVKNPPKQ